MIYTSQPTQHMRPINLLTRTRSACNRSDGNMYRAPQTQKAVTAYLKSKQLRPLGLPGTALVITDIIVCVPTSQQTRDIEPLLDQCWSTVYDAGPTLIQQWLNVSCLLTWHSRNGYLCIIEDNGSAHINQSIQQGSLQTNSLIVAGFV